MGIIWKNLNIDGDITELESLLANTYLSGVLKPMDTLFKNLDILKSLNGLFEKSKFGTVIMTKATSESIDDISSMFEESRGKIVEFDGFDFSNIGNEMECAADRVFFNATIDYIHIDNLNLYNAGEADAMFSGLTCKRLCIDTLDLEGVYGFYSAFANSNIDILNINRIHCGDILSILSFFRDATINCAVDLSSLSAEIDEASYAFNRCRISGELNLSTLNLSRANVEDLFTDAKIGTLNIVGVQWPYALIDSIDEEWSVFEGLDVDTLKISKSDDCILDIIQNQAKRIGKIELV